MRLLTVAAVVFGTSLMCGLGLAIVDLYLTGHGMPSIGAETLRIPALGVALSVSDMIMLGATALAGWIAWRATRRDRLEG